MAATQATGFAFNGGRIVGGMSAVGVPVWGPDRRVVAALSVTAIEVRMTPARIRLIVASLQAEAAQLKARLAASGPARPSDGGGGRRPAGARRPRAS